MKTFKQFIREYSFDSPAPKRLGVKLNPRGITQTRIMGGSAGKRGMVFRADPNPLPPGHEKNLKTYGTTITGSGSNISSTSGGMNPTVAVGKGEKKEKGLYAASAPQYISAYAGINRDEPRAWDNKTLYRGKESKDEPTTINAYKSSNFRNLPTAGERFSNHPGKPVGSTTIRNSSSFRKPFVKEKKVSDVTRTAKQLRKKDNLIGAENIDMRESSWDQMVYHATYNKKFDPKNPPAGTHFGTLHAAMERAKNLDAEDNGEPKSEGGLQVHAFKYKPTGKSMEIKDNDQELLPKRPPKGVTHITYKNDVEDPGSKSHIVYEPKDLQHIHSFKSPKFINRPDRGTMPTTPKHPIKRAVDVVDPKNVVKYKAPKWGA
jgi:hypothetical protein